MPELDVETRLASLEAKEEVREFIASYCAICDRIDKIGDLVDMFTEDGVLRNPAGVHSGRAAIESYYAAFFESKIAFGRYEDLVVKQAGVWRFKDKHNDIVANTSLEAGWAEGFGSAGAS